MPFYVGLDLGQSADFTALSVVQAVLEPEPGVYPTRPRKSLRVRHLERYPLRTPYPDIADKVAELMRSPNLRVANEDPRLLDANAPPRLAVDNTGVGAAVTDLLKKRRLRFKAITITGGGAVTSFPGGYRVPKRDLVAALEVPFHTGEIKVAEGLELWPALKGELLNFRRKINLNTAHDSYEHWRETDHDDLVLATALACWMTRRPRQVVRLIR